MTCFSQSWPHASRGNTLGSDFQLQFDFVGHRCLLCHFSAGAGRTAAAARFLPCRGFSSRRISCSDWLFCSSSFSMVAGVPGFTGISMAPRATALTTGMRVPYVRKTVVSRLELWIASGRFGERATRHRRRGCHEPRIAETANAGTTAGHADQLNDRKPDTPWMRLRHVSDSMPGIARIRRANGFRLPAPRRLRKDPIDKGKRGSVFVNWPYHRRMHLRSG